MPKGRKETHRSGVGVSPGDGRGPRGHVRTPRWSDADLPMVTERPIAARHTVEVTEPISVIAARSAMMLDVTFDPLMFGPQHRLDSQNRVGLGWLRDTPDFRDTTLKELSARFAKRAEVRDREAYDRVVSALKKAAPMALPPAVDNSAECSPIEHQGHLGSCTAHAAVGMIEYMERRAFNTYIDASRLFVYKTTRDLLGWTGDTGAFLRTTMKALTLFGAPPESDWPYAINRFDQEPTSYLYAYAGNYKALQYMRLDPSGQPAANTLIEIKKALSRRYVAMFGFSVFSSLTNDAHIPFPTPQDRQVGGHAVLAIGYDDNVQCPNCKTRGALRIRNSWGPTWGNHGYGWLPYDYVLAGLAVDFWTCYKFDWVNTGVFD